MKKFALIIGIVIVMSLGFMLLPVKDWFLAARGWIDGLGIWGPAAVAAAYAVLTVAMIPGSALTIGSGLIFGFWKGFAVVTVGANLGALGAFLLARTLFRERAEALARGQKTFRAVDSAIAREGFRIVLLLRLSPVFPFTVLNVLLGVTGISAASYVLANLIGMLPGTLMFVYLGTLGEAAAGTQSLGQTVLRIVGLAATVVVTVVITRIARRALKAASLDGGANPGVAPEAAPVGAGAKTIPGDAYDQALLASVKPTAHVNPIPQDRYNLVVIGAGTAGLVTAAGGAGLGAKVALIEKHMFGGDCLNVGCVPSKGIIRAGRAAAAVREAGAFGIRLAGEPRIDFAATMERMRRLRAGIAPHDSVKRFSELGIDVYLGEGRFTGPDEIEVGGNKLRFQAAVIATGARATFPRIPGIEEVEPLTNENVFTLTELPRSLILLGAGAIGCEMAQTFRRLGSEVTIVIRGNRIMTREDPDAALIVQRKFEQEGIRVLTGSAIKRAEKRGGKKVIVIERDGSEESVEADQILIGMGRAPNVEGLGLSAAGIAYGTEGVTVDANMRTTNPRVFAAGDICSRLKFTHAADAQARIVLRNALFFGRARATDLVIPWCTYTDPEIAHVGCYEKEARDRGLAVTTFTVPLEDVDRAILDGETEGFGRIHLKSGTDRILGATVVASHAGDMIGELTMAIQNGLGAGKLASVIHPYPTQGEVVRKLGDAYMRTKLTPGVKRIMARILRWRR